MSRIVLAAGGTGGHLFPAAAVAEALLADGHEVVLMTDPRTERYRHLFPAGVAMKTIRAGSLSGNPVAKLKGLLKLEMGSWQSLLYLRKLQPAAVIGFGGYPSLPPLMAAFLLRIPTVLHEQNAILGRTNRLMAPMVKAIASSFPKLGNLPDGLEDKVTYTGNPVRKAFHAITPTTNHQPPITILITGGSQGAKIFADIIPEAIATLEPHQRRNLSIVQQCRQEDIGKVSERYQDLGVQAELAPFFDAMPARLQQAQLVICRSGASTVFELLAAGKPGIFIPLPSAMDDHQTANARFVAEASGGWLLPQTDSTQAELTSRLQQLLSHPEQLQQAGEAAHRLAMPDAAARVTKLALRIAA